MRNLVIPFLITFWAFDIYSECGKYRKDQCFFADIISSEETSGFRGFGWQKYYETEIIEYGSNQRIVLLLKEKQELSKNVIINYRDRCEIFLEPFSGPFYDKIYRFENPTDCRQSLLYSVEQAIPELKQRIGEPVEKIKKYGFYRVKVEKNMWTYQSPQEITIDVIADSETCAEEYCFDESKQKIKDIVNIRKEYISDYRPETDACALLKNPKNRLTIFDIFKSYFCK